MYSVLTIGGKEYRLEYTIEASLYDECTEKLISFMDKTTSSMKMNEPADADLSEKEIEVKAKEQEMMLKRSISGISNLPQTALTIFYAGLMEHHGIDGDKTVLSKKDAKEIVKQYFNDHAEDGTDNFYDLLLICIQQMSEDGFFKRVGLEKIMNPDSPKGKAKLTKIPKDHKKVGEV